MSWAQAPAVAVGDDQDVEAWEVGNARDRSERHRSERRVHLTREKIPGPAVARLGDAVTGRDQNRRRVQSYDFARADPDVPSVREGSLHGRDRHAKGWPERGDAIVQRRRIPLRANDEGTSRICPPIGANRLRADGHLEAFR